MNLGANHLGDLENLGDLANLDHLVRLIDLGDLILIDCTCRRTLTAESTPSGAINRLSACNRRRAPLSTA